MRLTRLTFLVVYASTDSAPLLLARLEQNLQRWCEDHDSRYRLSMSMGWAVLDRSDLSKTIEELLAEADAQLYRQKQPGRRHPADPPFWAADRE